MVVDILGMQLGYTNGSGICDQYGEVAKAAAGCNLGPR